MYFLVWEFFSIAQYLGWMNDCITFVDLDMLVKNKWDFHNFNISLDVMGVWEISS